MIVTHVIVITSVPAFKYENNVIIVSFTVYTRTVIIFEIVDVSVTKPVIILMRKTVTRERYYSEKCRPEKRPDT